MNFINDFLSSSRVQSQLIASAINASLTILAITLLENYDYTAWLLISSYSVYLQSYLRSTYLEPQLLSSANIKKMLRKISLLTLTIPGYMISLTLFGKVQLNLYILFLTFAYCLLIAQDVLRYFFFKHVPNVSLISDLILLISILSIYSLFARMKFEGRISLIFAFCLGLFLSLSYLLFRFKTIIRKKNNNAIAPAYYVGLSNLLSFVFNNILIFFLVQNISSIQEKEFRLYFLFLAPLQVFTNLIWIFGLNSIESQSHQILSNIKQFFFILIIFFSLYFHFLFC